MENHEIALIFSDIADILEIKGENVFKVNAYRRAARIVSELSSSLQAQRDPKKLEQIPGIGKALAEKIIEMIETGRCRYYDELLSEPVAQVIQLTRIPDIGPKKAKLFYEHLGIMTVDQLEAEAKRGHIRILPGMGEKMEQKILRRIAQFREHSVRARIDEAWAYADTILTDLRKCHDVKRAESAGSLRRGRETIGDLDFLVTTAKPEKVIAYFVQLPYVEEVLAQGDTKASVRLKWNMQADLRVLAEEDFGAGWMYFTGSKEHNVALRRIAIDRGYKLNEYGLFRGVKEINASHGCSEAEIYTMLGLDYVEPEMRENRGEVEAASKKHLPHLIAQSDIRGDLHAHTTESDGRATLEDMADAAKALGYEYLAITDHSPLLKVAHGLDTKRVLKEIKAIKKFNQEDRGIYLLTGTEVEILENGALDHDEDVLAQMDIVIASVHSKFSLPLDVQTARIMKAIENPYTTILGHPTGRYVNQREPYEVNIEKVIEHAVKHHVVLEINASPERLDLKDTYIQYAKTRGAKFAISTDSHTTAQLQHVRYGIITAKRGWAETKDIVNTLPLKQLLAFLKQQRKLKKV